jgi:hypothetical protein
MWSPLYLCVRSLRPPTRCHTIQTSRFCPVITQSEPSL